MLDNSLSLLFLLVQDCLSSWFSAEPGPLRLRVRPPPRRQAGPVGARLQGPQGRQGPQDLRPLPPVLRPRAVPPGPVLRVRPGDQLRPRAGLPEGAAKASPGGKRWGGERRGDRRGGGGGGNVVRLPRAQPGLLGLHQVGPGPGEALQVPPVGLRLSGLQLLPPGEELRSTLQARPETPHHFLARLPVEAAGRALVILLK